jgi:hypothetical protein
MSESKAFSFEKKAKEPNKSGSEARNDSFSPDLNACSKIEASCQDLPPFAVICLNHIKGMVDAQSSHSFWDDKFKWLNRLEGKVDQGFSLFETRLKILEDSSLATSSKS